MLHHNILEVSVYVAGINQTYLKIDYQNHKKD